MAAQVLFKFGTPAQYSALTNYDDNALYFIQEAGAETGVLYKGAVRYTASKGGSGNVAFVTSIPAVLDSETLYVVNDGTKVELIVKGSDGQAQVVGGGATGEEISDIGQMTPILESVLGTDGKLTGGDEKVPTSGAVQSAIDTAINNIALPYPEWENI